MRLALFLTLLHACSSLRFQPAPWSRSRISLPRVIAAIVAPVISGIIGVHASAASDNVPVYFGVGCFWHVQHEFVEAEKSILGRSNKELTALAGYAGGRNNDKVCYHNLQGVADYGSLGHGEVVSLNIPSDKVGDFAREYFKLFDARGDRPDKLDLGLEYRSLLGLPGGASSSYYKAVEDAATEKGIKLVAGKGGDSDTLGKNMVWVMDTEKFPFYRAEVYHQFHGKNLRKFLRLCISIFVDGFMPGEQYPQEYNSIRDEKMGDGSLKSTGCPEKLF